MHTVPDDVTPDRLAAALLCHNTTATDVAAVTLLAEHGVWLGRANWALVLAAVSAARDGA